MFTRREFLHRTGMVSAGLLLASRWDVLSVLAAQKSSPNLTKFLDPLPIPPVLPPDQLTYPGADYYLVTIAAGRHRFHQQLPVTSLDPFTTWGYGGAGYLGPTIEAQRGRPVVADFDNGNLPLIPVIGNAIDTTLYHGTTYPTVRTTTHLHGGFTAPQFMAIRTAGLTRRGRKWGRPLSMTRTCTPTPSRHPRSGTTTMRWAPHA